MHKDERIKTTRDTTLIRLNLAEKDLVEYAAVKT